MKTIGNNIPDEIKRLEQWVCVFDDSKVPMRAWELIGASSSDPNTWVDFDFAIQATAYDWCGFVFAENGYVGIDIDCGFDTDGFITELGADIISMCHSYTEISRSGRGFHILLRGSLPFSGANNRKGVEIYQSKRYFIMTGKTLLHTKIIDNQDAIDYVVKKYFSTGDVVSRSRNSRGFRDRNYSPIWLNPIDGDRIRIRPTYPKVTPGSRNVSMLSLAGSLLNAGYTRDQIYDELSIANNRACVPPLSDSELQQICKSIARYEK